METFCRIRTIYRTIAEFEVRFEKMHHLGFNEGMLLCTLSEVEKLSSGDIAGQLGLTPSNASKVIKSVEKKGWVRRILGNDDKRQMYFSLTEKGREQLKEIACSEIEIPELLKLLLKEEEGLAKPERK